MLRRRELDIARVFAIIAMIAVHTEFTVYTYNNYVFSTIFDYLGSPFAAPTFMFILGINILQSSHNSPKELFSRGLKIFGISFLFNIVCHALPFFILDHVNNTTNYAQDALHWVFAVDILTFSGLAFMFFALVRKLNLKNWVVIAFGIAASVANCILTKNFPIEFADHPIAAAVTSLFYNSSISGYFSFLSWIIFPIAGYIFIQVLNKVKNTDDFYIKVGSVGLCGYLTMITISYRWFPEMPFIEYVEEYSYYQMYPFQAAGNILFLLAWISIMYFVAKILPKCFDKTINRLNRNLTPLYIIQWFLLNYCFVVASNGTFFVGEWQFIICFILVMIVSDLLATGYIKLKKTLA